MILANVKRFEQWDFNFFCNVILLSSETSADLGYYAEVFQRSDDQDPVKSFTDGCFLFVVITLRGGGGGRYPEGGYPGGVDIPGWQVSWQLGIPGGSYPVGRYPRGRSTPLQIPPPCHWYWHLVAATKIGMVGKRVVRILLECFLVFVCHFVLHQFLVCHIFYTSNKFQKLKIK